MSVQLRNLAQQGINAAKNGWNVTKALPKFAKVTGGVLLASGLTLGTLKNDVFEKKVEERTPLEVLVKQFNSINPSMEILENGVSEIINDCTQEEKEIIEVINNYNKECR